MQEELLTQYIDSLKSKISRIDSLLRKFNEGNSKAGDNIRLLAHTLHGSGASFGFPEISEAGKNAELADKEALPEKLLALKKVMEAVVANHRANTGAAISANSPVSENGSARTSASGSTAISGEKKPQPQRQTGAEAEKKNSALRVLIVDDDPEISQSIRNVLTGLPGEQVFTLVESGVKAQEAVVKNRYDLIVMDLLLPDKDGRELIELIKREFRIVTPLLVLSSLQNDSVRIECMGLGADKYLTKPYYDDVLLEETSKLLNRKLQKKLSLVPMNGEAVEDEEGDNITRPAYLAGKSILVAEDDKLQASLIQQRLEEEGAKVKHVVNGRDAMQLLRSQEFSLLILDVRMPVMDGFEVLQRVRQELNLELPIIMVTAMGSEDDIVRGYDLGVTDYILKPYSEVQLFARVKSLLKRKINLDNNPQ